MKQQGLRADLHTHSNCSDGLLSPAEVVRRAKEAGVELIALTDHDSMTGCSEAEEEAGRLGIRFVRGIEISAYLGSAKVHVLGYGCREGEAYSRFFGERRRGSVLRAADILKRANEATGLSVTMEEVERFRIKKDTPLHTMHIVRAFSERLSQDAGELYRTLFAPGRAAFSVVCRPSPEDAVCVIHEMGGIASLAHPAQILLLPQELSERFSLLTAEEREAVKERYAPERDALMEALAAAGLDGIECIHSTHTEEETERFFSFARGHGLLVTGGSDFHADGKGRRVGSPPFVADGRLLGALRLV